MLTGLTGICGGVKAAALATAFKLIESAQRRWRMVNAPHPAALVRAGATLVNGKLVEGPAIRHRKPAARRLLPRRRLPNPPKRS